MFLVSLKKRDRQPEIMDEPGIDPLAHHAALRGLSRINFFSGSARILWPAFRQLARARRGPINVLDVATGGGDVPIRLSRMAQRAGVSIRFTGYDISPTAVQHARQAALKAGADVSFYQRDVLKEGIAEEFDAITCSLFLHHLEAEEASHLLMVMRRSARHLVLVNDLERSRFGYLLAWTGSRLLSRSRVVHIDGPRSVRAAWSPAEALALAERAGLAGATVVRRWPCRYLLSWRRP